MFETIKKVYEEKIIKEHITSLLRDDTTLLQVDNVQDLDYINDLIIIEAGVTNINEKNGQLKDDHIYFLNGMKDNFQDQLLENVIDDDNKKDENVDKVMLWTTELLLNEKIIEIMINAIFKKNKKLFTRGTKINDWC